MLIKAICGLLQDLLLIVSYILMAIILFIAHCILKILLFPIFLIELLFFFLPFSRPLLWWHAHTLERINIDVFIDRFDIYYNKAITLLGYYI